MIRSGLVPRIGISCRVIFVEDTVPPISSATRVSLGMSSVKSHLLLTIIPRKLIKTCKKLIG